jgi:hypothetical protein
VLATRCCQQSHGWTTLNAAVTLIWQGEHSITIYWCHLWYIGKWSGLNIVVCLFTWWMQVIPMKWQYILLGTHVEIKLVKPKTIHWMQFKSIKLKTKVKEVGLYLPAWILFCCADWFYELLQCILVLRASDLSLTLAGLDMDMLATLPITTIECHKRKCSQWNTQRKLHQLWWPNKGTWRQVNCDTLWGEWDTPNCNASFINFQD